MYQNENFLELFLQPLTALVFGKTKTLETSGVTYSYYPLPLPSTVAGMIRSVILEHICTNSSDKKKCFNNHKDLLGDYGKYTGMKWVLIGPYLARLIESEVRVYYPQPIDTVIIERRNQSKDKGPEFSVVQMGYDEELLRTLMKRFMDAHKHVYKDDLLPILVDKKKKSEQGGGYVISAQLMKRYLDKNYRKLQGVTPNSGDVVTLSDIVKKKEDIGITLDKQKQVAIGATLGGMMYRVERLHYKTDEGWGIYVAIYSENTSIVEEIKNIFSKNEIIAKLGGEGGIVKVSIVDDSNLIEKDPKYTQTNKRSRLILTTPAIMNDQYVIPSQIAQKLYGVFTEELITGWSLIKDTPRKTLIGVKSGSIFIINPKSTISIFSRDYVFPEYRKLFGSALIGEV